MAAAAPNRATAGRDGVPPCFPDKSRRRVAARLITSGRGEEKKTTLAADFPEHEGFDSCSGNVQKQQDVDSVWGRQ
jgi:hypothetical protein